ncbi:MAG: hypothetical protein ACRD1O_03045, partial [Terriglobia bacterium]
SIQPGQKLSLPVRGLLKKQGEDADGPFGEGSIAIKYKGGMMAVVGQMSIQNSALSLIHESEMTENDPGMSDVPQALNGLWWGLGGGREAFVYVSNTAARPVIADVFLDFLGARHASQPLIFRGHETKVLSIAALLNSLNLSPSQVPEGGITIIGRGGPALIAEGAVMDPATGFSTTLHFLPPQMQLASTLVPASHPEAGAVLVEGIRSQDLRLHIGPRDPARLKEVCRSLAQTALTPSSDWRDALLALSYVPDLVAVPFLERVALRSESLRAAAVEGLARIANIQGMNKVISSLEGKHPRLVSEIRTELDMIRRGVRIAD